MQAVPQHLHTSKALCAHREGLGRATKETWSCKGERRHITRPLPVTAPSSVHNATSSELWPGHLEKGHGGSKGLGY